MENASKALLIAAAVLISVLLIAFGVGIYKSSKNAGNPGGTANALNTAITNAVAGIEAQLTDM